MTRHAPSFAPEFNPPEDSSSDRAGSGKTSKRKTPDDLVSSSSVVTATESISESGRPHKRQEAEALPFAVTSHEEQTRSLVEANVSSSGDGAAVEPEATTSSCTPATAAEVETADEPSEELVLEWNEYDADAKELAEKEKVLSISADEVIAKGMSLGDTRAAEKGKYDSEERYYTLKLVDRKKKKKAPGRISDNDVALNFFWWADCSHANLMNFNALSQGLADFCFTLWRAAGRKRNQYDDMAIEFGESPHCCVEVNELIADACSSGDNDTPETTYLDVSHQRSLRVTAEQGLRLVNGLVALIGQTSTLITHESDLRKLKIGYDERSGLGMETLRKGRGQSEWYIRTANDT